MISSVKDLEQVLKLCRKYGIDEIDVQGLKAKFGHMPLRRGKDEEPETPGVAPVDKFIMEQMGIDVA